MFDSVYYQYYDMSPGVRKPTIWILTRSDTNQAVQPLKMARGWKFGIWVEEKLYYPYSENKGADQFCVFVFAYAKRWFSQAVAHILFVMISIIVNTIIQNFH